MLIFEVHIRNEGVDAGRLLCRWEEESWLAGIRSELRELQHNTLAEIKAARPDFELPTDDEIERGLDGDMERIRQIAAELGPRIFGKAQAELQREVMIRFDQETGLSRSQDKELVRDLRQETSGFAQKKYHEHLGIRRGREAGQKDAKPRKKRSAPVAPDRRSKILAAIRAIGREPVYKQDVAPKLGISVKTLTVWIGDEEWEALVREALQSEAQK